MKARFRSCFVAVLATVAVTATAGAAEAQVFHPNDTDVSAVAEFPTLDYEGTVRQCDEGTATGLTGTEQSFVDLELTFSDNCNINGVSFDVTCSTLDPATGYGGARLIALDPITNEGTVDLNDGFFCDFVTPGVCVLSIDGPQNLDNSVSRADLIGEGTGDPKLDVTIDMAATRTGSSLCGPTDGTMNFTALYDMTPNGLSID